VFFSPCPGLQFNDDHGPLPQLDGPQSLGNPPPLLEVEDRGIITGFFFGDFRHENPTALRCYYGTLLDIFSPVEDGICGKKSKNSWVDG